MIRVKLTNKQEDGIGTAIQAIYRDLEYAKTLIKQHPSDVAGSTEDDTTEDWTLIGDETIEDNE